MSEAESIVVAERIERCIYLIRGQKVMLSTHLAELYGVEPKRLIQAVKRNLERFPTDFMFPLAPQEVRNLRSQIVTSSWGGTRYVPLAFTEQGVAMLSSVLRSPNAVRVNIEIMRTFVRLRQMLAAHADLGRKLEELEKKYDAQFKVVFDAIRQLMAPPAPPRRQIGFQVRERQAVYRVRRKGRLSRNYSINIAGPSPLPSPHRMGRGNVAASVRPLKSDNRRLIENLSLSPRQWGEGRGEGLRPLNRYGLDERENAERHGCSIRLRSGFKVAICDLKAAQGRDQSGLGFRPSPLARLWTEVQTTLNP